MSEPAAPFTIDDFFELIARSGLLDGPHFEVQKQRFTNSGVKPKSALNQLLAENLLTQFQARQLSERRHRGFFLSEKYKILDFIGQGGMSRVLLCEHLMLQRLVAVKILNKKLEKFPGAAERFLREARASASMDHPNIARVFDVDRTGLGPCIVMEYVDGTNLHDLTTRHGPLAINRVAHFIRQAASGLQIAHLAGLVHRDVKPANLMLDRTGVIKLLDLGLARFFDPTRSDNLTIQIDASSIIGTADYIAPEQVMESSSADIRADIYSLGLTMYFLLTKSLPAGTGPAMRKLLWHQTREPEPVRNLRPEIPESMVSVLERMIKKRPEDRYQTPAEVVAALSEWTLEPISEPRDEEMPKIRASSYRLGLCPPPDQSKFMEASTLKATLKIAEQIGSQNEPSEPTQTPLSGIASREQTKTESTIGYETQKEIESFVSQQSSVRSADTANVMSAAMETSSTSGASFIRNMGPVRIPKFRPPHLGLTILAAMLLAFGSGILFSQIWFQRYNKQAAQNSDPLNSNSIGSAASAESSQIPLSTRANATLLRGGGSTLIRPVMETWISAYEKQTGMKIEYSAVGSVKGIEGLISNFIDFGCTDVFLSDEQISDAGANIVHIPLAIGAVVPTFNVSDSAGQPLPLRFTGPLLANIYLGKVKRWNDPAIVSGNPGCELPDLPITVVFRKDGGGTTLIWTDYLSKISSAWQAQVGAGSKVTWPVGVGAEKNHGIADAVSRTVGAIGYVESSYAVTNGLSIAPVMNQSGTYIEPTIEGITSAAVASLKNIPSDLRFSMTDASGSNSYPIIGACWAILRQNQTNDRGTAMVEFLRWATTDGQPYLSKLQYGRLPAELTDKTTKLLDSITVSR